MELTNMLRHLFMAPEPITVAPPPAPPKGKRLLLRDTPLTHMQQTELSCAIHNYNQFTNGWLPHVRKLDNITAMYASSDSNKWFYRMLIDCEMDGKYYRMETYIQRYKPYTKTVVEITNREFNKPKTMVFSNDIIQGHK